MNIAILVENLPVPADRRVWNQAISLTDGGHDVTVICPVGKGYNMRRETIRNVDILRYKIPKEISSWWGYLIEYSISLFNMIFLLISSNKKYDVIQICNPPDILFVPAYIYKMIHGCYIVFDQHDLVPEMVAVKFKKRHGFIWKIMKLLEKITYSASDYIVANNLSVYDNAINRGRVPKEKVSIVRNGPRETDFNKVIFQSSWKKKDFHIGYIGVIGEQDSVDILVKALKYVMDQGVSDFHCHIVGDGPALLDVIKLVGDLMINEHFTFHGFLQGESFFSVVSEFDIGVAPDSKNIYSDKCTLNKVVEYMALGIPAVMFPLTENIRTAKDTGIYSADYTAEGLGEAILRIKSNKILCDSIGDQSRRLYLQELSWEKQSLNYLSLFEKIENLIRR